MRVPSIHELKPVTEEERLCKVEGCEKECSSFMGMCHGHTMTAIMSFKERSRKSSLIVGVGVNL